MWRFKSCPRCAGDVFIEKDIDGWYEQCLQCGYAQHLGSLYELGKQAGEVKKPTLAGAKVTAAK
ncbi:MAG TPA: hypothetical protein G4O13_07855 [Dehalococcoidia bacterium]|nr:hypothetical protein [Dehalococcoidia bacterium]